MIERDDMCCVGWLKKRVEEIRRDETEREEKYEK